MVFERRTADGHERHDEGVDAERDQLTGGIKQAFHGIAQTGKEIGAHLAAAEDMASDPEMAEMAREEITAARADMERLFTAESLSAMCSIRDVFDPERRATAPIPDHMRETLARCGVR